MRVHFASDHAGFHLRKSLIELTEALGHEVVDHGPATPDRVDYPDFANALADALAGETPGEGFGVLICGSGIGISIAANRHRHMRAALCHDVTSATLCRAHNDANAIAFGERLIGPEVANDCLRAFLSTAFDGGRHADRIAKMS